MHHGTLRHFAIAAFVLAVASSAARAAETAREEARRRPPEAPERRRHDEDSERSLAIHRAQSEIRKDPAQKQFILFRYGLRDEDLR